MRSQPQPFIIVTCLLNVDLIINGNAPYFSIINRNNNNIPSMIFSDYLFICCTMWHVVVVEILLNISQSSHSDIMSKLVNRWCNILTTSLI